MVQEDPIKLEKKKREKKQIKQEINKSTNRLVMFNRNSDIHKSQLIEGISRLRQVLVDSHKY